MHKQTNNTISFMNPDDMNDSIYNSADDINEIDNVIEECVESKDRRLRREERLRSKNEINLLFGKGSSFVSYPFRIVYTKLPESSEVSHAAMFVSVPKKKFKRAVKRNLLRRRSKEAYRLNKGIIIDYLKENNLKLGMAFLYLDKEIRTYSEIEKAMIEMLEKLKSKLIDKSSKKSN